jgi:hypothetical protein
MSYLTLRQGVPDFSKAVFSLWFRVPRESVIRASSQSLPTDAEGFFMMQGVLPLVTFGRMQENKNYQPIIVDIVHGSPPENPVHIFQAISAEPMQAYEVDPSYIGLLCLDDGSFFLDFNIQMEIFGTYNSLFWFVTRLDYSPGGDTSPGSGQVGDYVATIADGSYSVQEAQPEWFRVTSTQTFESDKWHHLLLSFDVDGTSEIGSAHPIGSCQLWYAIDDVDYRGWENMQPYRDEDDGLGDNIIVPRNVYNYSGGSGEDNLVHNTYVAPPSGSVPSGQVPSKNAEFALPAASRHVEAICRVEMAEFQMWTGVTLDTGINRNRHAFVDADGKPVDPTGTEDDLAPAVKLLGKQPEVMLHESDNWQDGYNTGTLGVRDQSVKIPAGQFTPVAGIEKYKPEPELGA